VQCVREHGDASGPPAASDLHQREGEVDEEGEPEGLRASGVHMAVKMRVTVVRVLVLHVPKIPVLRVDPLVTGWNRRTRNKE